MTYGFLCGQAPLEVSINVEKGGGWQAASGLDARPSSGPRWAGMLDGDIVFSLVSKSESIT